jgi:hypothetical protein
MAEVRDHLRALKILDRVRLNPLVPPRPNTEPHFATSDPRRPALEDSPSPLRAEYWRLALTQYPTNLGDILADIITHGALLGYTGPDVLILSSNLSSAHDAPEVLDNQLDEDLRLGRVCAATPTQPFISSPLGLVPKSDNTLRRIHHLSFPSGRSVNDNIPADNATLRYTAVTDIFEAVRQAGRGEF